MASTASARFGRPRGYVVAASGESLDPETHSFPTHFPTVQLETPYTVTRIATGVIIATFALLMLRRLRQASKLALPAFKRSMLRYSTGLMIAWLVRAYDPFGECSSNESALRENR